MQAPVAEWEREVEHVLVSSRWTSTTRRRKPRSGPRPGLARRPRHPKGHPDDFSLGLWTGAYDEATYIDRCQAWQRTLYDGGWAGITWPKEYGGRGGKAIEQVIFGQEQANYGVSTAPS